MSKLVEATHVTLGGEVGTTDWAFPVPRRTARAVQHGALDESRRPAPRTTDLRATCQSPTREWPSRLPPHVPTDFIDRMNSIPKHVATTRPRELDWNSTAIDGDVASFVDDLKRNAGLNLLKYGNGSLDITLMEHGLIDEFHLYLTPVAIGTGQHLFESIDTAPHLRLVDIKRFDSGVITLVYAPK